LRHASPARSCRNVRVGWASTLARNSRARLGSCASRGVEHASRIVPSASVVRVTRASANANGRCGAARPCTAFIRRSPCGCPDTVLPAIQEGNAMSSIVTAAILVIGDEILSGRTKDKNIGYIAEYLTNIGIDLKEVRVVPDEEKEIVDGLNALRHRYTYVFTTGGIGPTHDDITADSVAKAFGIPIGVDPRARAIMEESYKVRGIEMNEARLRMARMPVGSDLLKANQGPPGFKIGNVFVMAGVPSIMQVMLDSAAPMLKTGAKMLSETVRGDVREGDI